MDRLDWKQVKDRYYSSPVSNTKKKKVGEIIALFSVYGLFLSIKIMTAPMIATKMNNPAIAGMKYWSAIDAVCVA